MADPRSLKVISAAELRTMVFPPHRFTVGGLLPEGLTILAGAPKLGKSWMALQLCVAVSAGNRALGSFDVEQGDSLYLALEDSEKRLQTRLRTLGGEFPENLDLGHGMKPLTEGGEDQLRDWLESKDNPRLAVIDTYGRVRPPNARSNDYTDDVRSVAKLQQLALDTHTSIVLVHHTRKMASEDSFDEVLGSRGLTGVADSIWVLSRARNTQGATLNVTGRDIEERQLALTFQAHAGKWVYAGPAELVDVKPERQQLIGVLAQAGPEGMTPAAIAQQLGKDSGGVQQMLGRAVRDGQVQKLGPGRYVLAFSSSATLPAAA